MSIHHLLRYCSDITVLEQHGATFPPPTPFCPCCPNTITSWWCLRHPSTKQTANLSLALPPRCCPQASLEETIRTHKEAAAARDALIAQEVAAAAEGNSGSTCLSAAVTTSSNGAPGVGGAAGGMAAGLPLGVSLGGPVQMSAHHAALSAEVERLIQLTQHSNSQQVGMGRSVFWAGCEGGLLHTLHVAGGPVVGMLWRQTACMLSLVMLHCVFGGNARCSAPGP
jgi:hypothetical protein